MPLALMAADADAADSVPVDAHGLPAAPETWPILGVDVAVLNREAALKALVRQVGQPARLDRIAFLNAHGANLAVAQPSFRRTLASFTVLADGVGVDLAARMLHGAPFPDNLNGTDLVPQLLARLPEGSRVALFGGQAGVAAGAADRWRTAYPGLRFRVLGAGFGFDTDAILANLAGDPADLLLVAMGNPVQEDWIVRHVRAEHASVAMGVGALFDFVAGRVQRAPAWMIRLRVEWLYRLWVEPGRMWRRYVVGNPLFLWRVLRARGRG